LLQKTALPARGLLPLALESLGPAQLRKVHDGLAALLDAMGRFDPAPAERPGTE
jgi:hypothetical protein